MTPPDLALEHHRPARPPRLRQWNHWLGLRGHRYVWTRLFTISSRYGVTSSRAKQRVLDCVAMLARYDCRPTFPTPGAVVDHNSGFCQQLQLHGAELAVHGYHHVDFRALSVDEAREQFARAAAAYHRRGILFEGFRCPYLSCTDSVCSAVPDGDFRYSSNAAIWWDVLTPPRVAGRERRGSTEVFTGLSRLYQPESSHTQPSVPRLRGHLVEIPVCLPDDLQLLDGLALGQQALQQAWTELLRRTHQRGELFDLLFHPESFDDCAPGLEAVLREAQKLRPAVWVAPLCDISRWWREKADFVVEQSPDGLGMRLVFRCSRRATVLVRGLAHNEQTRSWYGPYEELQTRSLWVRPGIRPFVGVEADTPPDVTAFLQEQGYIVDSGPEASRCATYLDSRTRATLRNQVALVDFIEASSAPLVRFWRWPDGARSALCITGDLDALSLTDYAARLFVIR
jgi:hypothetical protein